MTLPVLKSSLIAFGMTAILLCLFRPLAVRVGLVDSPDVRKHHDGEVPLVGGVAMFAGFLFGVLSLDAPLSHWRPLFAGGALLVIVGVLDDFRELSTRMRFAAQILAALLMVLWGGVEIKDLGTLGWWGGVVGLGTFTVPLTVFAAVGVINAVNMSDGTDGLAGGLVLVALLCLLGVALATGRSPDSKVLMLLAAAVAAFLAFNVRALGRRCAWVFMGDAGSMFLGLALAWFFIELSQGPERAIAPVTALWILALPLFDTVAIMVRRALHGRSPFAADRQHLHHMLLRLGFSVDQVVWLMCLVSAMFACIGLLAEHYHVPEALMFYLFLGLFALYFWSTMRAWRVMRFLHHAMDQQQA